MAQMDGLSHQEAQVAGFAEGGGPLIVERIFLWEFSITGADYMDIECRDNTLSDCNNKYVALSIGGWLWTYPQVT